MLLTSHLWRQRGTKWRQRDEGSRSPNMTLSLRTPVSDLEAYQFTGERINQRATGARLVPEQEACTWQVERTMRKQSSSRGISLITSGRKRTDSEHDRKDGPAGLIPRIQKSRNRKRSRSLSRLRQFRNGDDCFRPQELNMAWSRCGPKCNLRFRVVSDDVDLISRLSEVARVCRFPAGTFSESTKKH